jgi:TRAP transporter TAXI family solute receptor
MTQARPSMRRCPGVRAVRGGWIALAVCAALGAAYRYPEAAQAPSPPLSRPVLRVTTSFGPFSLRLIEEYRRALPGIDVRPVTTIDSAAAVQAIENGKADFGLAYADAVFAAYWAPRGEHARSRLRGVSLLEALPLYALVRDASGIHQATDLRGRRVVKIGGTGTLSRLTLPDLVLRALAVDPATVPTVPAAEALPALAAGTLDAALLSGWVGGAASQYETIRHAAHIMPIEGGPVDRLRREYPFVRAVTIPRVLYEGQDRPIATVGMDVLVVCARDLPEPVVYEATKQMFIAFPRLSGIEATLRFLNLDEAAATPIPLHPGAARYFRERELSR